MKFTNVVDTVKNGMSCLSWLKVENGLGHTTDLKSWATQPVDLPDGFYVLADLQHDIVLPKSDPETMTEKYPKMPHQPVDWVPVSSDQAWALLEAAPCMSDDETRYYMNGVYIDTDGRVVATDGRRLVVEDAKFSPLVGGSIIPMRPVLKKFIKPNRKRARLEVGTCGDDKDRWIWFRRGAEACGVQLVRGEFPNVNRVIPDEKDYQEYFFDIPSITTLMQVSYLECKAQRVFVEVDGKVTVDKPDSANQRLTLGQVRATLRTPVAVAARFLKDAYRAGGKRVLVSSLPKGENKALIVPLVTGARQIIMPMQQD